MNAGNDRENDMRWLAKFLQGFATYEDYGFLEVMCLVNTLGLLMLAILMAGMMGR